MPSVSKWRWGDARNGRVMEFSRDLAGKTCETGSDLLLAAGVSRGSVECR